LRFYLGSHRSHWLGKVAVPLFVSHRTLAPRKSLPAASAPWALDSGGFTELGTYGGWRTSEADYVRAVRRYQDEIGWLDFAAPQDWMCEPGILAQTGLSVIDHQRRTVDNYLRLRESGLPFIPVLQGWERDDYLRCVDLYEASGVRLGDEVRVGLGTVCRRQAMTEAERIVLSLRPLRLHGFGMKVTGLQRYGYLLASSDSMAWSFAGRLRRPNLTPDCSRRACAHCLDYALKWRGRVLASLDYQQTHLEGVV
jgi:hypothetical protein